MALDQLRLNSNEQILAATKLRQDRLANSNLNQAPVSQTSDLSNITEAEPAEALVQGQNNSLSGAFKQLKQLKRSKDAESGRLNFKQDGLSTGLNGGKAEKFGSNRQSMTGVMGDLWQKAKAAKKDEKAGIVSGLKNQVKAQAASAINTSTSNLLQKAWLNVIDSYGLTLLYVNFHVLCRFIFGKQYFCKLGHEWLAGKGVGSVASSTGKAAGTAKAASASSGKQATSGVADTLFGVPFTVMGMLEAGLLALVDALIAMSLLISFTPLILMAYILNEPLKALWEGFGVFATMIADLVGGLI